MLQSVQTAGDESSEEFTSDTGNGVFWRSKGKKGDNGLGPPGVSDLHGGVREESSIIPSSPRFTTGRITFLLQGETCQEEGGLL